MWEFLNECYKIEKLAAKVYRKFSENLNYPAGIRTTFAKMADEEMEHARIIDLVMQTPEHELKATPYLSQAEVDELLRLVKASLVCAEHSEMGVKEALEFALQVEEQLVQVHANNALLPGDQKLDNFFSSLAQFDRDHVDQLRALIDN